MRAVQAVGDDAPAEFTVAGRISRPVEEVFEAVVDPAKLSAFFTTGGARGRIEAGATVIWEFRDFPGPVEVRVVEVVQNEKIVLSWKAADADDKSPYDTTVTMTFERLGEARTRVAIHESGWRTTAAGRKASYGNCEGWTGMLCAMRVWLEHGINLREGLYK